MRGINLDVNVDRIRPSFSWIFFNNFSKISFSSAGLLRHLGKELPLKDGPAEVSVSSLQSAFAILFSLEEGGWHLGKECLSLPSSN